MALEVRKPDIYRATLHAQCGNSGYLGFAPDGSAYHVVVPVDAQIARGIKAGNRPDDGTPFGGYRRWHYFECTPFGLESTDSRDARTEVNATELKEWAAQRGIRIELKE